MAFKYTEEQLNKLDKELLVQLFLGLQDQMEGLTKQTQALNDKMQLVMEQLVLSKKSRFGRSSEKMAGPGQIRFMEVDGEIVFFNEAEAVCDLDAPEPDSLEQQQPKKKKQAGKREADLAGLPVRRIDHYLSEKELAAEFGERAGNSSRMPFQDVTVLFRQKWSWRNTISGFIPVKQTTAW